MVPSWADQHLPQLLMEQFDTLLVQCRHIEHMHEGVWYRKNNFWQSDSCENLDNFSLIRFCICIDRAFMGRSTPATAFNEAIWYFAYTIQTHWTYAWRSLVGKNFFWQNDSYKNLDNYSLKLLFCMHGYCLLGPINSYHSNLMEQLDTLLIQCRHIEHMYEVVWFGKK